MPVVSTRTNASARGYGWSATIPESLDGMVLITPTSVDKAGTSSTATIGANGSVEFSACTSLSLNGVFTSDYDNYVIAMRYTATVNDNLWYRMRLSGTDNSTASSYVAQRLFVGGTTKSGDRFTNTGGYAATYDSVLRQGLNMYFYGPSLAQPTAMRSITFTSTGSAQIEDYAGTHNQSTSYDGVSLIFTTGNGSGLVSVYGLEN